MRDMIGVLGKFFFPLYFLGVQAVAAPNQSTSSSPMTALQFNKDWSFYNDQEIEAYNLKRKLDEKKSVIFALQQAKKSIINGDINLAKFFLSKVNEKKTELGLIKYRYLAVIAFIEGRYQESLDLVSATEFNRVQNYREICLLRVINLIALDDVRSLQKEVGSCQNLTIDYANSNQFWLTQMTKIKEKDQDLLKGNLIESFRNAYGDSDFTETWMKMALYLNKERIILKYIGSLPPEAYRSKKIRELIGFAYYRSGNIKRALDFIEDIESPNSDNIRGNVNLLEKKYELAFGHFKLALAKKENSENALKRSIPLSYILGLWDEGLDMLKRVVELNSNDRKKLILETLFFLRKEDFKTAKENILYLEKLYQGDIPRDLNQMNSYVALRNADNKALEKAASRACRFYDGLNCWLYLQVLQWENIGLTLKRDEPTLVVEDFDLRKLKERATITPLRESVTVDQRDIEELDNQQVTVDPK